MSKRKLNAASQSSHQSLKRPRPDPTPETFDIDLTDLLPGNRPTDTSTEAHGQRDPIFGQRGAFPSAAEALEGLDGEVEVEDESDAHTFLRSVRKQASMTLPSLLNSAQLQPQAHQTTEEAERAAIYNTGKGDSRGYFSDGAYIAAAPFPTLDNPPDVSSTLKSPSQSNSAETPATRMIAPSTAAFDSTLTRFDILRTTLQQCSNTPKRQRQPKGFWHTTHSTPSFITAKPTPRLLTSLNPPQALELLPRLTSLLTPYMLLHPEAKIQRVLGPWCWGLLARMAPVEELFSEDISVLRELAKKAAGILSAEVEYEEVDEVSLSEMQVLKILAAWGQRQGTADEVSKREGQEADEHQDKEQGENREADDIEAAKRRILSTYLADEDQENDGADDNNDQPSNHDDNNKDVEAHEIPTTNSPQPRRQRNTSSPPSSSSLSGKIHETKTEPTPARQRRRNTSSPPPSEHHSDQHETENKTADQSPSWQTEAHASLHLLDSILVVVGERYGQRDLLDVREKRIWGAFGGGF